MTVLSDGDLVHAIATEELEVEPQQVGSLQPASIDLRLDNVFLTFPARPAGSVIDPRVEQDMDRHVHGPDEPFVVEPGGFALGATIERIHVGPTLAARIEGKSSLGRLGIEVHSTAGWIDPGFDGQVTLEIKNVAHLPVLLIPGMWIAQLAVMRLSRRVVHPYGGSRGSHYQRQRGPTPSRAHLQFKAATVGAAAP